MSALDLRWHCNTCDDFDLCVNCHKQEEHEHELVQIGLDIGIGDGLFGGSSDSLIGDQVCIQILNFFVVGFFK